MSEPILFPHIRNRIRERREEWQLRQREIRLARQLEQELSEKMPSREELEAALERMPMEIREALKRA